MGNFGVRKDRSLYQSYDNRKLKIDKTAVMFYMF